MGRLAQVGLAQGAADAASGFAQLFGDLLDRRFRRQRLEQDRRMEMAQMANTAAYRQERLEIARGREQRYRDRERRLQEQDQWDRQVDEFDTRLDVATTPGASFQAPGAAAMNVSPAAFDPTADPSTATSQLNAASEAAGYSAVPTPSGETVYARPARPWEEEGFASRAEQMDYLRDKTAAEDTPSDRTMDANQWAQRLEDWYTVETVDPVTATEQTRLTVQPRQLGSWAQKLSAGEMTTEELPDVPQPGGGAGGGSAAGGMGFGPGGYEFDYGRGEREAATSEEGEGGPLGGLWRSFKENVLDSGPEEAAASTTGGRFGLGPMPERGRAPADTASSTPRPGGGRSIPPLSPEQARRSTAEAYGHNPDNIAEREERLRGMKVRDEGGAPADSTIGGVPLDTIRSEIQLLPDTLQTQVLREEGYTQEEIDRILGRR